MNHTLPLWTPAQERIKQANCTAFIEIVASLYPHIKIHGLKELYAWSIKEPEAFWNLVWDFVPIIGDKGAAPHLAEAGSMLDARWFPNASLNFAENLLRHTGDQKALSFYGEEKIHRSLTRDALRAETNRITSYLKNCGVTKGDVVAGLLPNMPEAIIGMLAASSLGATWTSCSPDFGASGVIDRFGQTEPKVLIASDGYFYRNETFPLGEKLSEIVREIPSIKHLLVAEYTGAPMPAFKTVSVDSISALPVPTEELTFTRAPFSHPHYIMYSSGTTGKPKCIVHSAGGTLLEHLKEHLLHVDLKPTDTITYQTTCGWMMWNWLVSALAVGAHTVLFDGFPFARSGAILFDIIDKEKISIFGTNAKFIASLEKEEVKPANTHSLSSLHTILSTGSPLLPESFEFVYNSIKKDVCLSSIAGGTDIIGCFALGSPLLPVYCGELQTRSLGLNVQVWSDDGIPLVGERGELVCTAPFPSQPVGFWNDPEKEKYRAAYFSRFPNVWHHGDYVELTTRGGMIFYGRSDTVLNPGGIRIGTAEIYRQVEKFPEIVESIVVGQEWENDVRVVLFVKLSAQSTLTEELQAKIKKHIKTNASPFHVPKKIIAVADIPRTRSGKISETAVRDIIHGKTVKNTEALLNPESLLCYQELPELLE